MLVYSAPHPAYSYTAEARAVFAAFTTPAVTLRKKQIDGAIRQLLSGPISGNDIFAKLDMFQMYRAADSQAALVDWKTPSRVASLVNAPTFTTDVGFTTNGTSSYINTNFNPGDGGVYNFTRDSAHFGVSSLRVAGTAGSHSGRHNGTNGITLQHRVTVNDDIGVRINQAGGTGVVDGGIITDGAYFLAGNRSGAAAVQIYRQGASLTLTSGGTEASTAVLNGTLLIGTINASSFQVVEATFATAGASLTANEHADLLNAALSFGSNTGAAIATRTEKFPRHVVRNVFDSEGRHYVIAGSQSLYVAEPYSSTYTLTYTFPDTPGRVYGLFVSSAGTVFVGTMDEATGIKGRTYRSTDQGATFTQLTSFDSGFRSGNMNFWGMCEDSNGDLYAGQYTVDSGGAAVLACKIWKSTDDGVTWADISDASWSTTNHVHNVNIDPATGWLYATIGDVDGLDGIWRSKLKDGSDWVRKTADNYQYVPLEFDGTYVYSGDDEKDGTIVRFADDGTSAVVVPTVVLSTAVEQNCYYLKRDPNGVFWACFPPTNDATPGAVMAGSVWISETGNSGDWHRLFRLPVMAYADWYDVADVPSSLWSLHTGTTQFGPQASNFFPALNSEGVKLWVAG